MTDRRSLMKILAVATLLGVARRASAQKTKSFTITYLALLPGEDRNFVPNFLRRLDQLGYVDGQNLHLSIALRKAGRNSCQALRPTSFG